MSTLMEGLVEDERRRRRVTLLVVFGCLTGLCTWLAAPFGIVLLTRGEPAGWVLLAAGVVLLALTVVGILAARRAHRTLDCGMGRPNPRFDEPQPSPDPRGGYNMAGTQLGSH